MDTLELIFRGVTLVLLAVYLRQKRRERLGRRRESEPGRESPRPGAGSPELLRLRSAVERAQRQCGATMLRQPRIAARRYLVRLAGLIIVQRAFFRR